MMHDLSDVVTDPAVASASQGARTVSAGTRGVDIKFVHDGHDIITGHPTNIPKESVVLMDPEKAAYYQGLEDRLSHLSSLVQQIDGPTPEWFAEYLDAGEYGLAVEVVSEALDLNLSPAVRSSLAAGLFKEAELMALPVAVVERLRTAQARSDPG